MKQKHFLISLTVLAIGISVDAQTKDNVKTTCRRRPGTGRVRRRWCME